jgi:hypothetical protein
MYAEPFGSLRTASQKRVFNLAFRRRNGDA